MDALLEKYMPGKVKEEAAASGPIDPLFEKYGLGTPVTATTVPEAERAIAPPMSGFTEQQSNELNKRQLPPEPSTASKIGSAAMALPVELGENIAKSFKGGTELYQSGLQDITSNQPASGVGKAALGGLAAAVSPITGTIKTLVEEPVTQLTGSKETGERAGFVVGSGLPVAKAGKMAVQAMPTNKALNAVIDTIGGPDKIKGVVDELKSNPSLSLMDVVPATKRMAQKLITTEGQHQNKFEKFVQERIGGGKSATTDIFDSSMGVPVNIVDKVKSLKQAARDVGKNEIEPAIKGSGFVDVSGVINNIDAVLKPGVNTVFSAGKPLPLSDIQKPIAEVRKYIMDEKSVRTDPKSLHEFQSALRAEADNLLNSPNPLDRRKGNALMEVRNDIVNAIDKASPKIKLADGTEVGSYKQALSSYRDEKQIENAFEMGQLVTRNKLGRLEDSPEFWSNWVKSATPQELEAAREGARLAVQHQISGFKAGARKGQDIVESEFNREKLSSLFGKDEIDKMTKLLKDERNKSITNSELIGNSQTAMRMKADSRVDLPVETKSSLGAFMAPLAEIAVAGATGYPGASGIVIAGQLGSKAKFKYATLPLAKARNEKITDLLTATGDDREILIKILESHIPKAQLSLGSKARLALPFAPP